MFLICGYPGFQVGFPGGSEGKASACNAGDPCSIPGLGRSPGEGNGNPLHYFFAWRIPWTEELGGLQSAGSERVGLSDFHFHFLRFFQIVLGPTRMDSF